MPFAPTDSRSEDPVPPLPPRPYHRQKRQSFKKLGNLPGEVLNLALIFSRSLFS